MGAPPPHEMVHQGTDASGMEEWRCPECGRHFVVRWPPDFERLVLAEGDGDAVHVGAKGEPRLTGIQVAPAAGEPRPRPRSSGAPGCATTASTGTARSPEAQAASAGSGGPASVGSARRGRRNSTEATAPTARAAAASR